MELHLGERSQRSGESRSTDPTQPEHIEHLTVVRIRVCGLGEFLELLRLGFDEAAELLRRTAQYDDGTLGLGICANGRVLVGLDHGLEQDVRHVRWHKLFDNRRSVVCRNGHPLCSARSLKALQEADWAITGVDYGVADDIAARFFRKSKPVTAEGGAAGQFSQVHHGGSCPLRPAGDASGSMG